ncbi:MAG: substrate-binding domain-containing protein [Actinobacteria bacterium]|nr:substrate-binding domain-containing protein [Actinomycetota bacterium]
MKKLFIVSLAFIFVTAFVLILIISGCKMQPAAETYPPLTIIEGLPSSETLPAVEPSIETGPEGKSSANFEIIYITKLSGIAWFEIVRTGLEQCARDYSFKATVIGPAKVDAAEQVKLVEEAISDTGIDAIVISPVALEEIDQVLARAISSKKLTFGHEGAGLKNITYDIEAVSEQEFGEHIMKSAIKYTGGNGSYICSVGFLNSISQNRWADAEIVFQQESAPDLKNVLGYSKGTDRFEDTEDKKAAYNKILEFIKAYPDLNLIVGNSMTTGIAAGQAIEKKGLAGKFFFVGTGLPVTIGDYIRKGVVQEGFFWDPYLVGYAIGYIALNTWLENPIEQGDAVLRPDGTVIEGYESLEITDDESGGKIISGKGQISINKDNIEEWYAKFKGYGWLQE